MPNFLNNVELAGTLTIGVDDVGYDAKFFGATSGKYMLWDEANDALVLPDATPIKLGTGADLQLKHTGSQSEINSWTGDLYLTQNANNKDIIFQSDDGSNGVETYFYLDGSDSTANPQTVFPDNSFLCFGGNTTTQTGDLYIKHNGSNSFINNYTGNLTIKNEAADKDIIFSCDDGSGGAETYFFLDGSASSGNPFTVFPDSSQLAFGTGNDMLLYHTGSHSYITNATGNLYIGTETSGVAIVIGHSTSEITIGDNILVQGNLSNRGEIGFRQMSTPGAPAAGHAVIWMDSGDGNVYMKMTNASGEVTTQCTLCAGEGE